MTLGTDEIEEVRRIDWQLLSRDNREYARMSRVIWFCFAKYISELHPYEQLSFKVAGKILSYPEPNKLFTYLPNFDNPADHTKLDLVMNINVFQTETKTHISRYDLSMNTFTIAVVRGAGRELIDEYHRLILAKMVFDPRIITDKVKIAEYGLNNLDYLKKD